MPCEAWHNRHGVTATGAPGGQPAVPPPSGRSAPLRAERCGQWTAWLAGLVPDDAPVALAAVGALGRGEPAPYSDLDLVVLHDGPPRAVAAIADRIWYPIWDSGARLDHSVRTVPEAIAVAQRDGTALLGLLDVRHVGGDESLTLALRARLLALWRGTARDRAGELRELAEQRHVRCGDAAFLLEPHLKDSRGALRDGQLLRAFALAHLIDVPPDLRRAYADLLDVRDELHACTGRAEDVLRKQEHAAVAAALGLTDGDAVLRVVNAAARIGGHHLQLAWRRVLPPHRRGAGRGSDVPAPRIGLARDVVTQDGEVVLGRDARPARDPVLLLRAARAAAEHRLPLAEFALRRLAAEAPPLPEPWPAEARAEFLALLGTGAAVVPVAESLDLAGLFSRVLPEWAAVRFRAQHDPVHRFTVDRHLLETAAHAATLGPGVDRPDLLLTAALLHDIGKGSPGDHAEVGAHLAAAVAARMGFPAADVAIVEALVRHHLLLSQVATRRDLDDPATLRIVRTAVGGSSAVLALLHALTVADSAATGPAAHTEWRAALVAELVRRVQASLTGDPPPVAGGPDAQLRELAAGGTLRVAVGQTEVAIAAPDRVGVLYRSVGVLALHLLDVRSASIAVERGMALNRFMVEPRFGRLPDPARLHADLARYLDGDPGLAERLRARERSYPPGLEVPATVRWFDDEATGATVLEYRAADAIGLLCRVAAALERCQLDVRAARISSLAGVVVDAFYLTTRDGAPVPPTRRAQVELELRAAGERTGAGAVRGDARPPPTRPDVTAPGPR
jgi:[protein-PII] uridylyltransferase